MLPKSQEREGGFRFPPPPPTLRGGPAHDSGALSQGRPSAAGLPLSQTQQTTLRTEAGEARAGSLKAICVAGCVNVALSPPLRGRGGLRKQASAQQSDVSLASGLSAATLAESRPPRRGTGEQPNGEKRLPPYPVVRGGRFYDTLGVKHTVNARERERIWELKNKRAKISNKGKLIKKAK